MVEKLVRLYHGSISFESEVGKGTTFTIVFPVRDEQA
jgi:signal transduction histidine kinase